MPKTLKLILDQVNNEIGFDIPTTYIGSDDPNTRQIVAITNGISIELRDMHLQKLVRQAFIDLGTGGTVDLAEDPDGQISWWPFPVDFYSVVPDTTYQNGRIDAALWPTLASDWAYLISRVGPQGLRIFVRTINNRIYVFSPDASQSLQFEYLSKFPIDGAPVNPGTPQPSAVVPRETFVTDNDVWLLDDRLIELTVMSAYLYAKGLDYSRCEERRRLYENELRARDQNATTIRPPWPYPWQGEPYTNLQVSNP